MEKEYLKEHAELFEPNAAELAAFRLHEAGVRFEILPPIGISEGRQSRVSILEYRVGEESCAVLWKRMGAGKGLTEAEALELQSRLLPYRSSMQSAGWNIPEVFYTAIVAIDGEYQIFSYEQLVGRGDGDKMLMNPQEPNFRKWHLLRRVMESLAAYPTSSISRERVAGYMMSRLPHGLDLKNANVVLDQVGKLWFVDLFGPKELTNEGVWRTYSTKLDSLEPERLLAVCATREGAALRMYRLAERAWSTAGGIETNVVRRNFIGLIETLGLPNEEVSFIAEQIRNDYPWLDQLYEERRV